MCSSLARSSNGTPISLSTTALQPFAPLKLVVASSHHKSRPPLRSYPNSHSLPRSRRSSKPKPAVSTYSSSTSVTSDSASSIYSAPPSEPPTVIPSKHRNSLPVFLKYRMHSRSTFASDEDDDEDEEGPIYTRKSSCTSLRIRFTASRIQENEPKGITTAPGLLGAGETETEGEDHHRHLPTSRILPSSGPLIPPNTLQQSLTPFLFEFSRWLSIVPALLGTVYNVFCFYSPPYASREDFAIATLWAILTGYQCLALTTGLLRRWRVYYTPLPTLIRLLALQAICWPATQITLTILDARQRPAVCWAIIGTTTCCSRSVQIWVTSNIIDKENSDYVSLRKWGGRKWDWGLVGRYCALPAGILYFMWTWVLVIRQQMRGC